MSPISEVQQSRSGSISSLPLENTLPKLHFRDHCRELCSRQQLKESFGLAKMQSQERAYESDVSGYQ